MAARTRHGTCKAELRLVLGKHDRRVCMQFEEVRCPREGCVRSSVRGGELKIENARITLEIKVVLMDCTIECYGDQLNSPCRCELSSSSIAFNRDQCISFG